LLSFPFDAVALAVSMSTFGWLGAAMSGTIFHWPGLPLGCVSWAAKFAGILPTSAASKVQTASGSGSSSTAKTLPLAATD
jgi:hypothetical protein